VYADLLIELANTYREKAAQSWVSLSDKIMTQVLGAVSMESVQAMMREEETGERFRTTLQQFLKRLIDGRVLDQGNPLSALCEAEAPPPAAAQVNFDFDAYFLDDGLFDF
jgi:hypothetical protein